MSDPVNHPKHYKKGGFEVIDVIEAFGLNFRLANTVKYVLRADDKHDSPLEDLKKARWYLDREISKLEDQSLEVQTEGVVTRFHIVLFKGFWRIVDRQNGTIHKYAGYTGDQGRRDAQSAADKYEDGTYTIFAKNWESVGFNREDVE